MRPFLLLFVFIIPCSLVFTCWEKADLLALFCVMFPCVFATFPYSVLGQVWYLIVSFPDLCLLIYLHFSIAFLLLLLNEQSEIVVVTPSNTERAKMRYLPLNSRMSENERICRYTPIRQAAQPLCTKMIQN